MATQSLCPDHITLISSRDTPNLESNGQLEEITKTTNVAQCALDALPEPQNGHASIEVCPPSANAEKVNTTASRFLKQNLALVSLFMVLLKEKQTGTEIQKVSKEIQELHATMNELNRLKFDLNKLSYGGDKSEYKLTDSIREQLQALEKKQISLVDDCNPQSPNSGRKISSQERSNLCHRIETEVKRLDSQKYDIVTIKAPMFARLMHLILEMAKGLLQRQEHFNKIVSENLK